MNLIDRFKDYWNTEIEYEDYKYDLSIFEMILYGMTGSILWFGSVTIILLTIPIWCIPYLIYKSHTLRKKGKK